jgi:hypothetical protein
MLVAQRVRTASGAAPASNPRARALGELTRAGLKFLDGGQDAAGAGGKFSLG